MTATQTSPGTTRPDTATPEYTEVTAPDAGVRAVTPVKPRRINLLPPEIGKQRAQARVKFYVFGGIGALVLVLAAVYFLKTSQVGAAKEELARQEDEIAALQGQIDDPALQEVVQKQADVEARATALSGAIAGEVSIPAMLNQIAIVIPDGTWLTSLSFTGAAGAQGSSAAAVDTGNAAAAPSQGTTPTDGAATGQATGTMGTLQVNGSGLGNSQPECSHDVSAVWLQTMQAWPAIENVWVSSSTKSGGGLCNVVDFTSDMELGSTLASGRAAQFAGSAGSTTGGAP